MTSKVLIAVPTAAEIHAMTAMTCHELAKKPDRSFIALIGRPVDYVRNCIMRLWRDKFPAYSHLLMVDSDTVLPLDAVETLLALDTTVATGCYPLMYNDGPRWALSELSGRQDRGRYKLLKDLPSLDTPFEVEGCGAGCLMLRRDIFEHVQYPWFRWIEQEDGLLIGEDFYFCDRVREAGLTIIADPRVLCRHIKAIDLMGLIN